MRAKFFVSLWSLLLASALVAAPSFSAPSESDFLIVPTEKIVWKEADAGAKMAVVFGDPSKPGMYVIRAYFPPGVMSSPHFHGEDRHVIVVQGTWNAGTDDSWDPKATTPLKTGTYMFHKAGAVHYDGSAGDEGRWCKSLVWDQARRRFYFPRKAALVNRAS